MVTAIQILVRMMKFNFNLAFIFHSDKSFEHEEGQRDAEVDNGAMEELLMLPEVNRSLFRIFDQFYISIFRSGMT
jgi:hypothetical protein